MKFGRREWRTTLLAFLVSVLSAAIAFAQQAATVPAEATSLREYVAGAQGRQAYGAYLAGRKVGWYVEELRLVDESDAEVAVFSEQFYFTVSIAGQQSVFTTESETVFELRGEGRVLRAGSISVEDGSRTETEAQREGDQLQITTTTGGRKAARKVPLPKMSLARQQAFDQWLTSEPGPGATFENYSLALDELDVDVAEHYVIESKKQILWGGVPVSAFQVKLSMRGAVVDATVSSTGRIIRGKIAGILEIRAEEEAIAKQLDATGVDMIAASAIRVDRELGDPEKVRSLTLKTGSLGDFVIPTSHRQQVERLGQRHTIIRLTSEHRAPKAEPLSDDDRVRWTSSSPTILSDHEDIRRQARAIVGNRGEPLEVARAIKDWIQANLRPAYAANGATALQVLANRSGDCTEHALLFVSLARAVGVPSREVGGVVYMEGARAFGWHAWAEIHDGRQWISVDPMWDQIHVDATHLKLSEGADDWAWVNVLGSLRLEVVKVELKD